MNKFWDERYRVEEYVYGKEPNTFFKEQISGLASGKILLPAEGEGRNAVYAASLGWSVVAFDPSTEGRKKALRLAHDKGVEISYSIATYQDFDYGEGVYDAAGLFFTHQPTEMKRPFLQAVILSLKPGASLIMEVFHKDQIHRDTGGPANVDLLFSEEELLRDLSGLEFIHLKALTRSVQEGLFHSGDADVVQVVAKKPR